MSTHVNAVTLTLLEGGRDEEAPTKHIDGTLKQILEMADRYVAMQLWPKTAIAYETSWDDTAMMQGMRGRYIWGAPVQPNLPDSQAGAVQQRPDEPHGKVDGRHVLGADGRLVSTGGNQWPDVRASEGRSGVYAGGGGEDGTQHGGASGCGRSRQDTM